LVRAARTSALQLRTQHLRAIPIAPAVGGGAAAAAATAVTADDTLPSARERDIRRRFIYTPALHVSMLIFGRLPKQEPGMSIPA